MEKHEKPFKMDKRRFNIVVNRKLRLRVCIPILENVLNLYYCAKAGMAGAALVLIVMHPILLYAFLMSINIIGDLTRNIVCLSVFLADCAFSFVGGVIVEYVRTR